MTPWLFPSASPPSLSIVADDPGKAHGIACVGQNPPADAGDTRSVSGKGALSGFRVQP